MSILWDYFWPAFGAGAIVGVIAGILAFRRRGRRNLVLLAGLAVALGLAALWHGPLGAAERFSAKVESGIRKTLVYYEMTQVTAHLQRAPLTRRVVLSGPADDFQRSELARLMDDIPGVAGASWSGARAVPLLAEGLAAALLGFLAGLLLAYLVELHRRHNAQWNW